MNVDKELNETISTFPLEANKTVVEFTGTSLFVFEELETRRFTTLPFVGEKVLLSCLLFSSGQSEVHSNAQSYSKRDSKYRVILPLEMFLFHRFQVIQWLEDDLKKPHSNLFGQQKPHNVSGTVKQNLFGCSFIVSRIGIILDSKSASAAAAPFDTCALRARVGVTFPSFLSNLHSLRKCQSQKPPLPKYWVKFCTWIQIHSKQKKSTHRVLLSSLPYSSCSR